MPSDKDRRREGDAGSQEPIKVTDRRHFNRAGERREPDAPAEPEAPASAPDGAAPSPLAPGAGGGRAGAAPARELGAPASREPGAPASREPELRPGREPEPRPSRETEPRPSRGAAGPRPEPGGPPSIDFVAFVQSLYVSALMAMGEVENPYTRQFETNLDLARENIDILAMLHGKTRGNLTAEEQSLIDQVVPQLQLLYVKKAS